MPGEDIVTPGRMRVAGLLALAAVVGPLFHVVLVAVLGSRWDGYDPLRDSTSELGGVGSPYQALADDAARAL